MSGTRDYWGKWGRASLSDEQIASIRSVGGTAPDAVFVNKIYEVWVQRVQTPEGWPAIDWLSIKRLDRRAIHDWRELQRIKNELCGPEREAVEIYPAESRKVDTSNQFHLWVFEEGSRLPFGYSSRCVVDESDARASEIRRSGKAGKITQRAFGATHERPDEVSIVECAKCPECSTIGQVERHTSDEPKYTTHQCHACGYSWTPEGGPAFPHLHESHYMNQEDDDAD